MLRTIRVILATLCLAGICLLFVDVSGELSPSLAVLARMQLVPALLAGSLGVVAGLLALTLVFGRVYCSVLCPLGVLQDVIAARGKKYRFRYAPPRTGLRLFVLGTFVLALLAGVPLVFAILEPYSAFGRIATDLLAPIWATGSNALAWASERAGNYDVAPTPVWQKGMAALTAATATLAVIGVLAWRSGRTWCNTLCPVGTVLGLLSPLALIRPRLDMAKCANCGLCARRCKASCIDATSGTIDGSRCVSCFNCIGACRHSAISYVPTRRKPTDRPTRATQPDPVRRSMLAAAIGLAAPVPALARSRDKSVPALVRKQGPERQTPITPPGSRSLRAFSARCTGCQLCVSACPNQVLKAFDIGSGMLQPTLAFERGYCRVNCVQCSTVCPTGAIRPISAAEKTATQIGRAVVNLDRCITTTDKVACTACARNCPPRAITLVGKDDEPQKPVVDAERCNGCGACEYVCPARPLAAIHVEGNLEHRRI